MTTSRRLTTCRACRATARWVGIATYTTSSARVGLPDSSSALSMTCEDRLVGLDAQHDAVLIGMRATRGRGRLGVVGRVEHRRLSRNRARRGQVALVLRPALLGQIGSVRHGLRHAAGRPSPAGADPGTATHHRACRPRRAAPRGCRRARRVQSGADAVDQDRAGAVTGLQHGPRLTVGAGVQQQHVRELGRAGARGRGDRRRASAGRRQRSDRLLGLLVGRIRLVTRRGEAGQRHTRGQRKRDDQPAEAAAAACLASLARQLRAQRRRLQRRSRAPPPSCWIRAQPCSTAHAPDAR